MMVDGTATVIFKREHKTVLAGSTIYQVFELLEIHAEYYLVLVNGILAREDQVLAAGDTVKLIPIVSGGD